LKILHINSFSWCDYLNDMVAHGGISKFGKDYVTSNPANYLYNDYANVSSLYGRGFTLYGKLPRQNVTETRELSRRILDRDFDYILYGSCFRDSSHLSLVEKVYSKDRIIFIDGEDHVGIHWGLAEKGWYFKRELLIQPKPNIHPINFAIPKDMISIGTKKIKEFAHIDPADTKTYIYNNEQDYYRDYQESYFAWTQRKAGWDCLRHYEILANGCFPAVRKLEEIPLYTMMSFPKDIVGEYYRRFGYKFSDQYWNYMDELYDWTLNKCTTESLWDYILRVVTS